MPAVIRRAYRGREEGIRALCELLSGGPLTTTQIQELAHGNRITVLGWLREGARLGKIARLTPEGRHGPTPSVWALPVDVPQPVQDPAAEGPVPFEDLCRRMGARQWYTATELSAYRDLLDEAFAEGFLEMCRRWYQGRPGRKATIYRLTQLGEICAGIKSGLYQWVPVEGAR